MKKFFLKIVFMVSLISLYCINAISSEIDTISFPSNHINYWSGSGNSEVFMVVDFNNDSLPESFIWGYRFNDSIKVNELIKAIDSVDQRLEVIYNGIYISDIIYDYKNNATDIYSAVGGSPDYFNMFVGKLDSLWDYNWNIGPDMYLKDGDYLGLSYTASDSNYNPLNYPDGNPASAKPIIDLDFNNIEYWLGSGDKQIALVIDFQSDITESALIWGIKYSSSITLIEAIKLVDSLDNRLTINYSGNYINDIIYDYYYDGTNLHTAYAGDPCWFNMYIGEDSMEWETNWGIGPTTVMENNQMIGLSYTPSDANYNAILTPSVIFEFAKEGLPYSVELAEYWIGEGADSALLVIDFDLANGSSSFTWGYLFNDSTDAGTMLTAIASEDTFLNIDVEGGFLNSLYYDNNFDGLNEFIGEGGNPNYWSTWSAKNGAQWYMNNGISTKLVNGSFFGCTYTDFNPALAPNTPVAAIKYEDIPYLVSKNEITAYTIYPNPCNDYIKIQNENSVNIDKIILTDIFGKLIVSMDGYNGSSIDVSMLNSGVYFLQIKSGNEIKVVKLVK